MAPVGFLHRNGHISHLPSPFSFFLYVTLVIDGVGDVADGFILASDNW